MDKKHRSAGKSNRNHGQADANHDRRKTSQAIENLYICLTCGDAIEDNDSQVGCHECRKWAHKSCTNLTKGEFEFLSKSNSNLQWVCDTCLEGRGERVGKLEAKIDRLTDAILKISEKLVDIENAKCFEDKEIEKKIEEVVDRKVTEALGEKLEIEKRQYNVIITNLPESGNEGSRADKQAHDIALVKEMIGKVCPELEGANVEDPIRLGKINIGNRPRLLKVKMGSVGMKQEFLRNAFKINKGINDPRKMIFVNPDRTPREREAFNALRAEKMERERRGEKDLVIRNGKIVKRKIQGQVQEEIAAEGLSKHLTPENSQNPGSENKKE